MSVRNQAMEKLYQEIKLLRRAQGMLCKKVEEQQIKIEFLLNENQKLKAEKEKLKAEYQELKIENEKLKAQIAKDSHNSSKPPSSDGYNKPKPKSQRKKSGKKVGGQNGHRGVTLEPIEHPDIIEVCQAEFCDCCGASLEKEEVIKHERRQRIDIKPTKPEVTEFLREVKKCAACGFLNKAKFPEGVTHRVQYGSLIKAYAAYFNQYQHLPYARTQEIFEDCFSLHVSQGTLVRANELCHKELEIPEGAIKQAIIESGQAHFDETGLRVNKKLHWLHSASTPQLTYYDIQEKRGRLGMDEVGILPKFKGCAIHDHLKSYFHYDCEHSLCNAHHLRELIYSEEQFEQHWAQKLRELLIEIKESIEDQKALGRTKLTLATQKRFSRKYSRILREGLTEIPEMPPPKNKRGKPKQHKSKNLLDRLKEYKQETLRFMNDFKIPFDNNLAERDIRPTKLKQKISGCFRTSKGSKQFCRIRSYISTIRKNQMNVLESLVSVFQNTPILPKFLETQHV